MSRIGNQPIPLPPKVEVTLAPGSITVKGPLGSLTRTFGSALSIGVMALLENVHGTAIQREMLPYVQYILLYALKTLFGIKSMNALPALLCSDAALMP